MTVRVGGYEFDDVAYDADADVLYLHRGEPKPAAETLATPEGHAVRFDASHRVMGITIVNIKWLAERDGQITISIPERIEAPASDFADVLVA
jgi:uncharacterized protein YuzE